MLATGNSEVADTISFASKHEANASFAAAGDVTVYVNDRYRQCLTYYVAAKCLERDDSDTQNLTLAASYMNNFAAMAKA